MSRKAFIESVGATCRNWTWSWAFVNESQRHVIFGAWDNHTEGGRALILDEAWRTNATGRKNAAYSEAREYLRLVEEKGFDLRTFPMIFSDELQDASGTGPARIKSFGKELTRKTLVRVGTKWYACDDDFMPGVSEELLQPAAYPEGARKTLTINGFERNRAARAACLAHYGLVCAVCGFDGRLRYGPIGAGVIHVHHITPVAEMKTEYILDPTRDLIPVCPTCHAVIHSARPALTVEQVRDALHSSEDA